MKQRNVLGVMVLTLVTLGIYGIVWSVKTKNEMNKLGATIPTAWLIIIPLVNIWWLWKYSEGVEKVTNGKLNVVLAFLVQFLAGFIGMGITQYYFNEVATAGPAPEAAATPAGPVPPANPVA